MNCEKKIITRKVRKKLRSKKRQLCRGKKLRISVHKSARHIYAQIIDDNNKTTLASFSSKQLNEKDASLAKKEQSGKVGIELGKIALSKKISDVFFDRGGHLYHGRVLALAEGLRESGLKF